MCRTPATLRHWLSDGPYSLVLSSGFFGFFAHCGVLSVLEAEGLRPQKIYGSSAGALAGGLWAAGIDTTTLAKELLNLRRQDFWDPSFGIGLLRGLLFQQKLEALLSVSIFEHCPIPLAISVFDILSRETRVISAGPLALAIHASCAVPGLFQPVMISGRPTWDGGVADRPGLAGVSPGERVFYHHLGQRSPWRRKHSPALKVPERANMVALVVEHLPRVHPFGLALGAEAFRQARRATEVALSREANRTLIRVSTAL